MSSAIKAGSFIKHDPAHPLDPCPYPLEPIMLLTKVYYNFKFLIPRPLQIRLRRYLVRRKLAMYADIWPIGENRGRK